MIGREHIDVNKWARVARQIHEAAAPAPTPRPPVYGEPTVGDRRAWNLALARPCERHGAGSNELCFDGGVRGMCAARTKTLGHVAASQRRDRGTTKEAS